MVTLNIMDQKFQVKVIKSNSFISTMVDIKTRCKNTKTESKRRPMCQGVGAMSETNRKEGERLWVQLAESTEATNQSYLPSHSASCALFYTFMMMCTISQPGGPTHVPLFIFVIFQNILPSFHGLFGSFKN